MMNGSAPSLAADETVPLLCLEGVSFSHGTHEVLHDISMRLQRGALTTLLGPSGSGKTTLLQILGGHLKPSRGTVWLDGTDATHLPPESRGLGLVHQHLALFPHLTVERNVSFGLEVRGKPIAFALEKARATLQLVDLPSDTWTRRPDSLSGGQRQRVAIARALAFGPRALLLDEPFTALDRVLRQRLCGELKRIQRETGVTTLLVTHDQEEALALSDSLLALREGRVVQAGPPAELYQRPRDPWLAGFLGEANLITRGGFLRAEAGECLLVRPEELVPGDQPDSGDYRLQGPVRNVVFRGADSLVTFEAAGLVWKMALAGTEVPRPGEIMKAILPATAGWNVTRGCRP